MKITGRHLVVTPALRQHIENRFERLERYEVKLCHLEVILGVSKLQHSAEVVCTMQGRRIQAKASTRDEGFPPTGSARLARALLP